MTKVIKIEKNGGPEVLKAETINLGKPETKEVQIEQKAYRIKFYRYLSSFWLYPVELPTGIGAEGSGIIKEIGSKLKIFQ